MATKAKVIMQLACAVAGEDVSTRYGPTIRDALDALTDALAGTDVADRATIADELSTLGGRVTEVTDGIKALRAALVEAGADVGGGSLAEVLDAAAGGIGSDIPLGAVFATDDEVRAALGQKV